MSPLEKRLSWFLATTQLQKKNKKRWNRFNEKTAWMPVYSLRELVAESRECIARHAQQINYVMFSIRSDPAKKFKVFPG